MPKLIWNNVGDRYFELGVDKGVLYTEEGFGVAWNGLVSVKGSPSGGDATPYYLDGVKYFNAVDLADFKGQIDAYTYPEQFAGYDGWTDYDNGLTVDQQHRKPFCFSYRTLIGNDVDGETHGYKIHIVYNVLVSPSEHEFSSLGEDVEPLTFSWSFTTTPIKSKIDPELMPSAHLVVDSTKTNPTQMRYIENVLYGTFTRLATLLTFDQVISLFKDPLITAYIHSFQRDTGLSETRESLTTNGDLRGRRGVGLYVLGDNSRIVKLSTPGYFTLEQ